ncbi:uncharacterized protein LOC129002762 isoform X2 [Macrosteles quadrilineatus]|uniref:uncharacterized protein LOC129002762 isoform X2 n=1 Tax=Macrosteles quadrilineatus TaxID=74068 RepID=UPI0023E25130|nr:uncharacterized protein LOC129002762 isoform X2 [Macrosteles quadrilineatus]
MTCLKKKCIKLEEEKIEAVKRCEELKISLERFRNRKCTNCSFLTNELKKERQDKEKLKKEEKAKLLKTIVKTLANIEDGNTNPMNQMFTELVCAKLNQSQESNRTRGVSLIEDTEENGDEDNSKVLVDETILVEDSENVSCPSEKRTIIIPETEATESPKDVISKKTSKDKTSPKYRSRNMNNLKENIISLENEEVVEQASKKLRLSPILCSQNVSPSREKLQVNQTVASPSVLSDNIEAAKGSILSCQNDAGLAWTMKPGGLVEAVSTSAPGGKKLKQMTLSLSRPEKKHDISLSGSFKGGVAKNRDEDIDVILPSPEQNAKKLFGKKTSAAETLEDPDMTVFNPMITSTCLPAPGNTSFDRLPDMQKSPKYKYRRETVRKKTERMRLPGQDCDECAKYYEAAGLDQSVDVRARLDKCSRHRDKYQLRANTPPGFWDPVLPLTPEENL